MKKNGTLVNSKSGITVKIAVVEGTGRGVGKEYISLTFSAKPSDTVRDAMKKHHFHFYKVDGTWSAYKTDNAMNFAYSLIKENNITTPVEDSKPQKTARGSANKKSNKKAPTTDERLNSLENDMTEIKSMLKKLLSK